MAWWVEEKGQENEKKNRGGGETNRRREELLGVWVNFCQTEFDLGGKESPNVVN